MPSLQPSLRPTEMPAAPDLRRLRLQLHDGAVTTLHVAAYAAGSTDLRIVRLRRRAPLAAWCAARGVSEALVGGFYVRPGGEPLGELRTRGMARAHVPFTAPWDSSRACAHVFRGEVRIAPRGDFGPAPRGDLLQAGPLLVCEGEPAVVDGVDPEGFSSAAHQFDSDITDGRHPRAALALTGTPDARRLLAVACDGRADDDAGLTLGELAEALLALGATDALNLDGGGSTSLVCGGQLRNTPREAHEAPVPGGRAISTALVFAPRA
jgi:hypothetical protein